VLLPKQQDATPEKFAFHVQAAQEQSELLELVLLVDDHPPVRLGLLSEDEARNLYKLEPANALCLVADAVLRGFAVLQSALK
jgi:anti-sigma-K factor RskA